MQALEQACFVAHSHYYLVNFSNISPSLLKMHYCQIKLDHLYCFVQPIS